MLLVMQDFLEEAAMTDLVLLWWPMSVIEYKQVGGVYRARQVREQLIVS